jgi:hypothetical protein
MSDDVSGPDNLTNKSQGSNKGLQHVTEWREAGSEEAQLQWAQALGCYLLYSAYRSRLPCADPPRPDSCEGEIPLHARDAGMGTGTESGAAMNGDGSV